MLNIQKSARLEQQAQIRAAVSLLPLLRTPDTLVLGDESLRTTDLQPPPTDSTHSHSSALQQFLQTRTGVFSLPGRRCDTRGRSGSSAARREGTCLFQSSGRHPGAQTRVISTSSRRFTCPRGCCFGGGGAARTGRMVPDGDSGYLGGWGEPWTGLW